jgi:hypothetical protein
MARDLRLDTMRGLLLAEITLVHTNSPIAAAIFEMFGRVSPAAAFVFLSGLMAGAVYSRAADRGARAIVECATRRAFHTYQIATYAFLMAVVVFVPRANDYFHFAIGSDAVASQSLIHVATLTYQPALFDILPLYTVFVLAMPAAILAYRKGQAAAVFAISVGLWGLAQMGWGHVGTEIDYGDFRLFNGAFNPLAWQILFFTGLYIGHMQMHRRVPVVRESVHLVAVSIAICAAGLALRWNLFDGLTALEHGTGLASKGNYGLFYLVNFFAFAYLVFVANRRAPKLFTARPLAFLGQHSIQVFSFHIVAVYLAMPLAAPAGEFASWGYDALAFAVVASLFLPAFVHQWYQSIARSRRPAPAPAQKPAILAPAPVAAPVMATVPTIVVANPDFVPAAASARSTGRGLPDHLRARTVRRERPVPGAGQPRQEARPKIVPLLREGNAGLSYGRIVRPSIRTPEPTRTSQT